MLNLKAALKKTIYGLAFLATIATAIPNISYAAVSGDVSEKESVSEEMGFDPEDNPFKKVPLKGKVGSVTLKLEMPWDIHEIAFVLFTNAETYEEYAVEVFEANLYETTLNLPAGKYMIGGGLIEDRASRFRVEGDTFEVKPYTNTAIHVKLIDHLDEVAVEKEAQGIEYNPIREKTTVTSVVSDIAAFVGHAKIDNKPENIRETDVAIIKKHTPSIIVFILAGIGSIIGLFFILKKEKEEKRKRKELEDFDL